MSTGNIYFIKIFPSSYFVLYARYEITSISTQLAKFQRGTFIIMSKTLFRFYSPQHHRGCENTLFFFSFSVNERYILKMRENCIQRKSLQKRTISTLDQLNIPNKLFGCKHDISIYITFFGT